MNPRSARTSAVALTAGIAIVFVLSGCTMFTPKQAVRIDAIRSGTFSPRGAAYVIEVPNQELKNETATYNAAVAAVDAALQDKGQFPAPAGTDPQYVVEVDYGAGFSIPQTNSGPVQEKYLSLSARNYTGSGPGDELWNVRTTVAVAGSEIDQSLPLLAAVALDYAGSDTHGEQTVMIPVNSPAVARVRNAATAASSASIYP